MKEGLHCESNIGFSDSVSRVGAHRLFKNSLDLHQVSASLRMPKSTHADLAGIYS